MRYLIILAFLFVSCGTEPPEEKEEECETVIDVCCKDDGSGFKVCVDD